MSATIVLVGDTALSFETARMARASGLRLELIASRHPPLRAFAAEHGIALHDPDRLDTLPGGIDWLISAGNLDLLHGPVLDRFTQGAINFHDGPLPERAGRNVPVWALIEGARHHAITWHLMTPGVDRGDILLRRDFEIAPDETAASLNARCFAAALESLPELFEQMRHGLRRQPQPMSERRLHRAADRPEADALIDGRGGAAAAAALVRALDHGAHANPLCCPKIDLGDRLLLIGGATQTATGPQPEPPGSLRPAGSDAADLVFEDGVLRLTGLRDPSEAAVAWPQDPIRLPEIENAAELTARMARAAATEPSWRARLEAQRGTIPPGLAATSAAPVSGADAERRTIAQLGTSALRAAAWAVLLARICDGSADIAIEAARQDTPHLSDWLPLRIAPAPSETLADLAARLETAIATARDEGSFAVDLPARLGVAAPALALGPSRPGGARLGFDPETGVLEAAPGALLSGALDLLADRLETLLDAAPTTPIADLPRLGERERHGVVSAWNATDGPVPEDTIHAAIARRATETPEATALVFGAQRMTLAEMEASANRMARVLREMGAKPGVRVGLHLNRSAEMVVAALAVLKTGAAYLPLDPGYPADRIALYLEDSAAELVVTEAAVASALPPGRAHVLRIDDPRLARAAATPIEKHATAEDLAYLIYTSGSTGRPKGVMIEHRHVLNFFEGMDARVPHAPGDTLLAVTSISFDISVLELFWSLSRGLVVVIQDEAQRLVANGNPDPAPVSEAGPSLSLFYWGHEASDTGDYALLLDGARFADAHGFEAVWTPERHFHGFGAAYPNPAVTGAAVAAVTSRLAIRAGSCVAPLHHPARIAEDWAVIDRLSGGRAGLAMAAGWQPRDFVLRPEAAPPHNRAALRSAVDEVRRLWRGEAVAFADADGEMQEVLTRPRPISAELPLWITIAGNPDSWREAGLMGANVLTHLLGQSVEDLAQRVIEWRAALAEAGHDPAAHRVTVMLHTYLDETRAAARETARAPMSDYLRSASGLIARHAAAFPAFRRGAEQGVDPGALTPEEEAAVLDHAFERYFEEQGLFGTVADGRARLEQLRAIGVDEIACLIDFGIAPDQVMQGLPRLAQLIDADAKQESAAPGSEDISIAAQIRRHGVTHLQCTPSMARLLVADETGRASLGGLRHMLVGGEALPKALASELIDAGVGHLENMYGPTETTVWSTSATVTAESPASVIGTPIRNTRTYVLDADMAACPVGEEGELWIGGAGVARGYWQRPEMTAERFRPDPFRPGERIYRTGDLARWRADATLEFLGRADSQVKLRGHRIELGEVEAAVDAVSGLGPCVVVAREDSPGDVRLVAYVETAAEIDEAAMRHALAARLPAIMVPARIVALARFPLTPNRKIDRAALPAPQPRRAAPMTETAPESTRDATAAPGSALKPGEAAAAVAAIWRELLGVETVAPGDSFFALGGHSLLAVRAHREIRDRFGIPGLKITDIFGLPRLADLAARIEADLAPAQPAEAPAAPAETNSRDEMMARRRQLRARRGGRDA